MGAFTVSVARNAVQWADRSISGRSGRTQVPAQVIAAIQNYLMDSNANSGGAFLTSGRSDKMIANTRAVMADFFHCDSDEVVFGSNMTTLTFALSRAIGRELGPGDSMGNRHPGTEVDRRGRRGGRVHRRRGQVQRSSREDATRSADSGLSRHGRLRKSDA